MIRTKSLIVIGIVFFLISIIPDNIVSNDDAMDGGYYYGHVVQTTGSITIHFDNTPLGNRSFNLFIVIYDDALRAFEEGSLENSTILFKLENLEEYTGVVTLSAGTYVVFITPSDSEAKDARFHINISRTTPHPRVLFLALVMIGIPIIEIALKKVSLDVVI
jgi:hypothetical protein